MSTWYVYIVRCKDKSLYTGISTDVEKRLATHNAGKGASYTKSRRPVRLLWQESVESESLARKREFEIKKWSKQDKELFIKQHTL